MLRLSEEPTIFSQSRLGPAACFEVMTSTDIAVAELIIKRYDTSVYLSADAAVADIRMDTVRKIDRHSAYRQINNVAARRKYKHLIGKNIHLYRIHEIT